MKSQYDEETIVLNYLGGIQGKFMELGAFDGVTFSNTYCLLERGWRGVLVEPSPTFFLKLLKNMEQFSSAKCVNCAVSDKFGIEEFFENGARSTIVPSDMNVVPDGKKFYVATCTLDHLFSMFGRDFDFIDIDIELSSLSVLKSLPVASMHNLKMICVEKWKDWQHSCDSLFSEFKVVADTSANLFYFRSGGVTVTSSMECTLS